VKLLISTAVVGLSLSVSGLVLGLTHTPKNKNKPVALESVVLVQEKELGSNLVETQNIHMNTPSHVAHMNTPSHVAHMSTPSHVAHMNTPSHVTHSRTRVNPSFKAAELPKVNVQLAVASN
jgi:hypothetical protein